MILTPSNSVSVPEPSPACIWGELVPRLPHLKLVNAKWTSKMYPCHYKVNILAQSAVDLQSSCNKWRWIVVDMALWWQCGPCRNWWVSWQKNVSPFWHAIQPVITHSVRGPCLPTSRCHWLNCVCLIQLTNDYLRSYAAWWLQLAKPSGCLKQAAVVGASSAICSLP